MSDKGVSEDMRAVKYLGNRKCRVDDIPLPEIGPKEVLVKIKVSCICGSDLWGYRTSDGALEPLSETIVEVSKIPVPGHEPSGIVEKIGSCVSKVKIGERVAVYHKRGCGKCQYCLEGKFYFCKSAKAISEHIDGSCAEYLLIDEINCLNLPDTLSFNDGAVLMCAGGTAFSGIKKLDLSGADVIAIIGMGPIGMCSLVFAKAFGAKTIAVDLNENRLKLAKSFGADHVINCKNDIMVDNVYEVSPGIPMKSMLSVKNIYDITNGNGASAVALGTGNIQARINAIDCAAKGGKVVLMGMSEGNSLKGDLQKSFESVILKELKIFGSNVFSINEYWEIIKFMELNKISIGKVITDKFSIDDCQKAFALADTESTGKVAIVLE